MLNVLRTTALTVATLTAVAFAATTTLTEAQSYQIDCAILLCLSGGWPASVPCARARAEFIRRITPWPVEPPLQIWRCPMGAAYPVDPDALTGERIYEILFELDQTAPLQSFPVDVAGNPVTGVDGSLAGAPAPTFPVPRAAILRVADSDATPQSERFLLHLAQDRADIDISGPEFNFVRSIRVFQTQARQWESGGEDDRECNRYASVRLGSYGTQGNYSWRRSGIGALPDAHIGVERYGDHCPGIWHRSVFVEWRDYEGNYGYEQVNY